MDPRAGHGFAVARGAVPRLRPPAPARLVARRAAEGDDALAVRSCRARCLLLPGAGLAGPAGQGASRVAGPAGRRRGATRSSREGPAYRAGRDQRRGRPAGRGRCAGRGERGRQRRPAAVVVHGRGGARPAAARRRARRGQGLAVPAKGRQPRRTRARADPATENRKQGLDLIRRHPLFAPLAYRAVWSASQDDDQCPAEGWAMATSLGYVYLNPRRRGEPEEWAWVAAHCLLHLGFDHLAEQHLAGWRAATGLPSVSAARSGAARSGAGFDPAWNLAACVTVNRFLSHLKVGRPPEGLGGA